MARIRTIKPEFCESESIGRLSREARLAFVLLWTRADDEGRIHGNNTLLAKYLYPYDKDAEDLIDGWLVELETVGCIVRYVVDDKAYVAIPKWTDHQKIDHPSRSKLPAPESSPTPTPRDSSTEKPNPRESSRNSRETLAKPLEASLLARGHDRDRDRERKGEEKEGEGSGEGKRLAAKALSPPGEDRKGDQGGEGPPTAGALALAEILEPDNPNLLVQTGGLASIREIRDQRLRRLRGAVIRDGDGSP